MEEKKQKSKVLEMVENAKHIAVMPTKVAGADAFCAGVGLFYMLKELDKRVDLIYQGKVPVGTEDLIPENEITSDVTTRDLVIEVDYSGTSADKVHYNANKELLTLSLGPVPMGFDPETRVKARLSGFEYDLIFTIGVQNLHDLGQVYTNLEEKLLRAMIINIDNTKLNENFGVKNFIDTNAPNLSILVFNKATQWGLNPSIPAAKAILTGITLKGVDSK